MKGKTMKAQKKDTTAAQKNLRLAEGLRAVKGLENDDQEALYCLSAMLGGLEMLRMGAEAAESWHCGTDDLSADLASHLDAIEAELQKRRDGIMYVTEPEEATA